MILENDQVPRRPIPNQGHYGNHQGQRRKKNQQRPPKLALLAESFFPSTGNTEAEDGAAVPSLTTPEWIGEGEKGSEWDTEDIENSLKSLLSHTSNSSTPGPDGIPYRWIKMVTETPVGKNALWRIASLLRNDQTNHSQEALSAQTIVVITIRRMKIWLHREEVEQFE